MPPSSSWKMLARGKGQHHQRQGPLIWFHTDSVAESGVTLPLVFRCLTEYSEKVVVLVTTVCQEALSLLQDSLPPRVIVELVSFGNGASASHFIEYWRPQTGVFMDCAYDMSHLLNAASRHGVSLALLDAHIPPARLTSANSRPASRHALAKALRCFALILPQTELDLGRFKFFGVTLDKMLGWSGELRRAAALGASVWHAARPPVSNIVALRKALADRPLWLAVVGSAEEAVLVGQAARLLHMSTDDWSRLLTIVVVAAGQAAAVQPAGQRRKAARTTPSSPAAAAVEAVLSALAELEGLSLTRWRDTRPAVAPSCNVLLVEEPAEASLMQAVAEVAYIGNTTGAGGSCIGHLAEAAISGCAVVLGACGEGGGPSTHHQALSLMADDLNEAALLASREAAAIVRSSGHAADALRSPSSPWWPAGGVAEDAEEAAAAAARPQEGPDGSAHLPLTTPNGGGGGVLGDAECAIRLDFVGPCDTAAVSNEARADGVAADVDEACPAGRGASCSSCASPSSALFGPHAWAEYPRPRTAPAIMSLRRSAAEPLEALGLPPVSCPQVCVVTALGPDGHSQPEAGAGCSGHPGNCGDSGAGGGSCSNGGSGGGGGGSMSRRVEGGSGPAAVVPLVTPRPSILCQRRGRSDSLAASSLHRPPPQQRLMVQGLSRVVLGCGGGMPLIIRCPAVSTLVPVLPGAVQAIPSVAISLQRAVASQRQSDGTGGSRTPVPAIQSSPSLPSSGPLSSGERQACTAKELATVCPSSMPSDDMLVVLTLAATAAGLTAGLYRALATTSPTQSLGRRTDQPDSWGAAVRSTLHAVSTAFRSAAVAAATAVPSAAPAAPLAAAASAVALEAAAAAGAAAAAVAAKVGPTAASGAPSPSLHTPLPQAQEGPSSTRWAHVSPSSVLAPLQGPSSEGITGDSPWVWDHGLHADYTSAHQFLPQSSLPGTPSSTADPAFSHSCPATPGSSCANTLRAQEEAEGASTSCTLFAGTPTTSASTPHLIEPCDAPPNVLAWDCSLAGGDSGVAGCGTSGLWDSSDAASYDGCSSCSTVVVSRHGDAPAEQHQADASERDAAASWWDATQRDRMARQQQCHASHVAHVPVSVDMAAIPEEERSCKQGVIQAAAAAVKFVPFGCAGHHGSADRQHNGPTRSKSLLPDGLTRTNNHSATRRSFSGVTPPLDVVPQHSLQRDRWGATGGGGRHAPLGRSCTWDGAWFGSALSSSTAHHNSLRQAVLLGGSSGESSLSPTSPASAACLGDSPTSLDANESPTNDGFSGCGGPTQRQQHGSGGKSGSLTSQELASVLAREPSPSSASRGAKGLAATIIEAAAAQSPAGSSAARSLAMPPGPMDPSIVARLKGIGAMDVKALQIWEHYKFEDDASSPSSAATSPAVPRAVPPAGGGGSAGGGSGGAAAAASAGGGPSGPHEAMLPESFGEWSLNRPLGSWGVGLNAAGLGSLGRVSFELPGSVDSWLKASQNSGDVFADIAGHPLLELVGRGAANLLTNAVSGGDAAAAGLAGAASPARVRRTLGGATMVAAAAAAGAAGADGVAAKTHLKPPSSPLSVPSSPAPTTGGESEGTWGSASRHNSVVVQVEAVSEWHDAASEHPPAAASAGLSDVQPVTARSDDLAPFHASAAPEGAAASASSAPGGGVVSVDADDVVADASLAVKRLERDCWGSGDLACSTASSGRSTPASGTSPKCDGCSDGCGGRGGGGGACCGALLKGGEARRASDDECEHPTFSHILSDVSSSPRAQRSSSSDRRRQATGGQTDDLEGRDPADDVPLSAGSAFACGEQKHHNHNHDVTPYLALGGAVGRTASGRSSDGRAPLSHDDAEGAEDDGGGVQTLHATSSSSHFDQREAVHGPSSSRQQSSLLSTPRSSNSGSHCSGLPLAGHLVADGQQQVSSSSLSQLRLGAGGGHHSMYSTPRSSVSDQSTFRQDSPDGGRTSNTWPTSAAMGRRLAGRLITGGGGGIGSPSISSDAAGAGSSVGSGAGGTMTTWSVDQMAADDEVPPDTPRSGTPNASPFATPLVLSPIDRQRGSPLGGQSSHQLGGGTAASPRQLYRAAARLFPAESVSGGDTVVPPAGQQYSGVQQQYGSGSPSRRTAAELLAGMDPFVPPPPAAPVPPACPGSEAHLLLAAEALCGGKVQQRCFPALCEGSAAALPQARRHGCSREVEAAAHFQDELQASEMPDTPRSNVPPERSPFATPRHSRGPSGDRFCYGSADLASGGSVSSRGSGQHLHSGGSADYGRAVDAAAAAAAATAAGGCGAFAGGEERPYVMGDVCSSPFAAAFNGYDPFETVVMLGQQQGRYSHGNFPSCGGCVVGVLPPIPETPRSATPRSASPFATPPQLLSPPRDPPSRRLEYELDGMRSPSASSSGLSYFSNGSGGGNKGLFEGSSGVPSRQSPPTNMDSPVRCSGGSGAGSPAGPRPTSANGAKSPLSSPGLHHGSVHGGARGTGVATASSSVCRVLVSPPASNVPLVPPPCPAAAAAAVASMMRRISNDGGVSPRCPDAAAAAALNPFTIATAPVAPRTSVASAAAADVLHRIITYDGGVSPRCTDAATAAALNPFANDPAVAPTSGTAVASAAPTADVLGRNTTNINDGGVKPRCTDAAAAAAPNPSANGTPFGPPRPEASTATAEALRRSSVTYDGGVSPRCSDAAVAAALNPFAHKRPVATPVSSARPAASSAAELLRRINDDGGVSPRCTTAAVAAALNPFADPSAIPPGVSSPFKHAPLSYERGSSRGHGGLSASPFFPSSHGVGAAFLGDSANSVLSSSASAASSASSSADATATTSTAGSCDLTREPTLAMCIPSEQLLLPRDSGSSFRSPRGGAAASAAYSVASPARASSTGSHSASPARGGGFMMVGCGSPLTHVPVPERHSPEKSLLGGQSPRWLAAASTTAFNMPDVRTRPADHRHPSCAMTMAAGVVGGNDGAAVSVALPAAVDLNRAVHGAPTTANDSVRATVPVAAVSKPPLSPRALTMPKCFANQPLPSSGFTTSSRPNNQLHGMPPRPVSSPVPPPPAVELQHQHKAILRATSWPAATFAGSAAAPQRGPNSVPPAAFGKTPTDGAVIPPSPRPLRLPLSFANAPTSPGVLTSAAKPWWDTSAPPPPPAAAAAHPAATAAAAAVAGMVPVVAGLCVSPVVTRVGVASLAPRTVPMPPQAVPLAAPSVVVPQTFATQPPSPGVLPLRQQPIFPPSLTQQPAAGSTVLPLRHVAVAPCGSSAQVLGPCPAVVSHLTSGSPAQRSGGSPTVADVFSLFTSLPAVRIPGVTNRSAASPPARPVPPAAAAAPPAPPPPLAEPQVQSPLSPPVAACVPPPDSSTTVPPSASCPAATRLFPSTPPHSPPQNLSPLPDPSSQDLAPMPTTPDSPQEGDDDDRFSSASDTDLPCPVARRTVQRSFTFSPVRPPPLQSSGGSAAAAQMALALASPARRVLHTSCSATTASIESAAAAARAAMLKPGARRSQSPSAALLSLAASPAAPRGATTPTAAATAAATACAKMFGSSAASIGSVPTQAVGGGGANLPAEPDSPPRAALRRAFGSSAEDEVSVAPSPPADSYSSFDPATSSAAAGSRWPSSQPSAAHAGDVGAVGSGGTMDAVLPGVGSLPVRPTRVGFAARLPMTMDLSDGGSPRSPMKQLPFWGHREDAAASASAGSIVPPTVPPAAALAAAAVAAPPSPTLSSAGSDSTPCSSPGSVTAGMGAFSALAGVSPGGGTSGTRQAVRSRGTRLPPAMLMDGGSPPSPMKSPSPMKRSFGSFWGTEPADETAESLSPTTLHNRATAVAPAPALTAPLEEEGEAAGGTASSSGSSSSVSPGDASRVLPPTLPATPLSGPRQQGLAVDAGESGGGSPDQGAGQCGTSYLRYQGEYILPATQLPAGLEGPAVWRLTGAVGDAAPLAAAVSRLLRDALERRSRGVAAAQGAAKLASGLVGTVWQVLDDKVVAPALFDFQREHPEGAGGTDTA